VDESVHRAREGAGNPTQLHAADVPRREDARQDECKHESAELESEDQPELGHNIS
jgi:hypothetical protein